MAKSLYTLNGAQISIGRELGRGGEAAVFEVPSSSDQVAKIYHKAPEKQKQAKLRFMAQSSDPELLGYVAWPQTTLHSSPNGPVVGFLMGKVVNKEPAHMFYSPAHRRQAYPKAAWDFLIYVSRNIAASFAVVHSHGFVIGDVNQDGVMVGRDSKVSLIDSDSFQVKSGNELFLCEVGVPLYTPPELQTVTSFHGLPRTANHDNFGLALLIFHVLLGGRHPFAGVPLRNGVGDALENDIQHFRYAYARDNKARGFSPPPKSIPPSILPPNMEAMFTQAFTEPGAKTGRPTAQQWVSALDSLRAGLKKCNASAMHMYAGYLSVCPWCELEKQGAVFFVDLGATTSHIPSGINVAQVWGLIQAVPVPGQVITPALPEFTGKAIPLPSNIPGKVTVVAYRLITFVVAMVLFVVSSKLWFLSLIILALGWTFAGSAGNEARLVERKKRLDAYNRAKSEYDRLLRMMMLEAGSDLFMKKKAELAKVRDELLALPQLEKKAIDGLQATAHERQKQRFLETFFIDDATIAGVGPTRKAALRSFGIETAADITKSQVRQVKGFGESLTRAVLDWKAACERRFVFNAANAVSNADKDAVSNKFRLQKVLLEKALGAGPAELRLLQQRAQERRSFWEPRVASAGMNLLQARADLSLIN